MTQNIEQRTEVAVKKYEGASATADKLANTDSIVDTPVGKRDSFPKLSREIKEKADDQHDIIQARSDSQYQHIRDRFSVSQQPIVWSSGVMVSDEFQRYFVGILGEASYKELLPNPLMLPFETGSSVEDDILENKFQENGIPRSVHNNMVDLEYRFLGTYKWPDSGDSRIGDIIPFPVGVIQYQGENYCTSEFVSGEISNVDLSSKTATIGGERVFIVNTRFLKGTIFDQGFYIDALGPTIDNDKMDFWLSRYTTDMKLSRNLEYVFNRKVVIPPHCKLDLNGALQQYRVDGSVECFVLSNYSEVFNGSIDVVSTNSDGTSGQHHAPVLVGDFFNPVSVKGWAIYNLSISSNKPNGNGIAVIGNCYNGRIHDIEVDGKGNLGRAVLCHWGNTKAIPPTLEGNTGHPHNISIDGINAINGNTSHQDGFAVFISGGYNISTKNVDTDNFYGVYQASAGEPSNGYATSTIKPKILKGLTTENLSGNRVVQPYKLSGFGKDGVQPAGQPPIGQIEMVNTNAFNTDGTGISSAVVIYNWPKAILVGGDIRDYTYYGIQSRFECQYVSISGFSISGCGWNGIALQGSENTTTQADISGNVIQKNGHSGDRDDRKANIFLDHVQSVSITEGNRIGSTQETALNHVYLSGHAQKVTIDDNIIFPTSGGAAFKNVRSATPANAFYGYHVLGNNKYENDVVTSEGAFCIEVKNGLPVALAPKSAIPSTLDGDIGFEIEIIDAEPGDYKRLVKVQSGQWKGYGKIEL